MNVLARRQTDRQTEDRQRVKTAAKLCGLCRAVMAQTLGLGRWPHRGGGRGSPSEKQANRRAKTDSHSQVLDSQQLPTTFACFTDSAQIKPAIDTQTQCFPGRSGGQSAALGVRHDSVRQGAQSLSYKHPLATPGGAHHFRRRFLYQEARRSLVARDLRLSVEQAPDHVLLFRESPSHIFRRSSHPFHVQGHHVRVTVLQHAANQHAERHPPC